MTPLSPSKNMSIVRMCDIHAGHSLQPVVPRVKDMESADRRVAALRISDEMTAVRTRLVPFNSYATSEDDPFVLLSKDEEDRLAREASQ